VLPTASFAVEFTQEALARAAYTDRSLAQLAADIFSQLQPRERSRGSTENHVCRGSISASWTSSNRIGPLLEAGLCYLNTSAKFVQRFHLSRKFKLRPNRRVEARVSSKSIIPFPCGSRGIDLRGPAVRVVILAGRRRILSAAATCASRCADRRGFRQLAPFIFFCITCLRFMIFIFEGLEPIFSAVCRVLIDLP